MIREGMIAKTVGYERRHNTATDRRWSWTDAMGTPYVIAKEVDGMHVRAWNIRVDFDAGTYTIDQRQPSLFNWSIGDLRPTTLAERLKEIT